MTDRIGPFEAELWAWTGPASWVFLSLPTEFADTVRVAGFMTLAAPKRGWKMVRVEVQIGDVRWQTSLFPDKESGSFILPVKAAVRRQLGVSAGDRVRISLRLLDMP
jgi:hypothetical protein